MARAGKFIRTCRESSGLTQHQLAIRSGTTKTAISRATFDVDVMADLECANVERLAAALRDLGARVRGIDAHPLDVDPFDPEQLGSGANWTLVTDAGWLDFMPGATGARGYAQIADDAVAIRDGAFRVVVRARDTGSERRRSISDDPGRWR